MSAPRRPVEADDFIADDFEPDAEQPPLPGYERQRARALVLPQVDVVGDASAPTEGPSLGSSTMREGPGEYREIDVDVKREAPRQEYGSSDAVRDTLLMLRRGGDADAARGRVLDYADRAATDAAIGSSEGTTGEYQGDRAGTTALVTHTPIVGAFADEARARARSAMRGTEYSDELGAARRDIRASEEQGNPYVRGAGTVGGMAASAAIPIPGGPAATVLGRIGQGAAMGGALGTIEGFGRSEAEDVGGQFTDAAIGGVVGAGAGGLVSGAVEGALAVPPAVAQWLRRRGEGAQQLATQARLEASGVWGGRALQAADELPGGQEALARDLRRLQVGERGAGQVGFAPTPPPRGMTVPRPDRAVGDAEAIRRAAGDMLGRIAQQADEAGGAVPTQSVIDGAEQAAAQLEELGTQTAMRAAARIRSEVAPMAGRPDMTFSQAWRLRQLFDSLADFSQTPGADEALMTAGGQFQRLRQVVSGEMDGAMAQAAPQLRQAWRQASRDYQVGAFMRAPGGAAPGAQRLSTQGGMGGAAATGVMQAMAGGNPLGAIAQIPGAIVARQGAQETRMLAPGVTTRVAESVAERAPAIADWLTETLRSTPQALGPYARHFRQALERGLPTEAVATVHFLLSQRDPEYRATVERARQQESDR
jgi:hypothetical protein